MQLMGYVRDGFRVLLLDRDTAERLSEDRDSFGEGLLIVMLAGLALGACGLVTRMQWIGLFVNPVAVLLSFLAILYLVHMSALLLGGDGSFLSLLRPAACGFILGWGLLIPWVGVFLLLWYLVALGMCVHTTHRMDMIRAGLAVALPLALGTILFLAILGAASIVR